MNIEHASCIISTSNGVRKLRSLYYLGMYWWYGQEINMHVLFSHIYHYPFSHLHVVLNASLATLKAKLSMHALTKVSLKGFSYCL